MGMESLSRVDSRGSAPRTSAACSSRLLFCLSLNQESVPLQAVNFIVDKEPSMTAFWLISCWIGKDFTSSLFIRQLKSSYSHRGQPVIPKSKIIWEKKIIYGWFIFLVGCLGVEFRSHVAGGPIGLLSVPFLILASAGSAWAKGFSFGEICQYVVSLRPSSKGD